MFNGYCGEVILWFQLLLFWLCRPGNDLLGVNLVSFVSVVQYELEFYELDSSLLFRHILDAQCIHQLRLQVSENRDGGGCTRREFLCLLPAVHALIINQHVYPDENPVHEKACAVVREGLFNTTRGIESFTLGGVCKHPLLSLICKRSNSVWTLANFSS